MAHDAQSNSSVTKRGPGDYQVSTDIVIDAPASLVWEVLTDFESMPGWSSSLQGIDGELEAGKSVMVDFKILGRVVAFEHNLFEFEDGVQFGWSDPIAVGITDRHVYRIEPLSSSSCRFVHLDQASGGLARFVGPIVARAMARIHVGFNSELKAEVDARRRSRP